jgi:hypothetical protein
MENTALQISCKSCSFPAPICSVVACCMHFLHQVAVFLHQDATFLQLCCSFLATLWQFSCTWMQEGCNSSCESCNTFASSSLQICFVALGPYLDMPGTCVRLEPLSGNQLMHFANDSSGHGRATAMVNMSQTGVAKPGGGAWGQCIQGPWSQTRHIDKKGNLHSFVHKSMLLKKERLASPRVHCLEPDPHTHTRTRRMA